MNNIPVTRPHMPDKRNLDSYLSRVYESGWLTNNGVSLRSLTDRLTAYLDVDNILLVNNGTEAIMLALKALGVKDNIVSSPFTFAATTSAPIWNGNTVMYADIDPDTFNLDVQKVSELGFEIDVGAILPVHVFGVPCEVDNFERKGRELNCPVIYDAAHAFGVRVNGESILMKGDMSVLSFHATKIFHTVEGGAIVFSDSSLLSEVQKMINFGYGADGNISAVGINYKMSEIHAAYGHAVLDEIDDIFSQRKRIYEHYYKRLSSKVLFQKLDETVEWNYSYCPILLCSQKQVQDVIRICNLNNIYPRRYFYPSLDTVEVYSSKESTVIGQDISSRVLCLPSYTRLSENEIDQICDIILKVIS
jgi:dTDP-4-amino-4,6-dideoxygalactose transaminase